VVNPAGERAAAATEGSMARQVLCARHMAQCGASGSIARSGIGARHGQEWPRAYL
jgi:hypothetical protein